MTETAEARLKRLAMRSIRRGIKEMDLILGAYSAARLATMESKTLTLYDALLSENDQDLYLWVTGQADAPPQYLDLIGDIASHAGAR